MTLRPTHPLSVYLSYAQEDEALKQEFESYLVILQQDQFIAGWTEHQVQPGAVAGEATDPRLMTAELVVVLLSPALLASGYCDGAEVREMFARRKKRELYVTPILLRQVDLTGSLFDLLAPLPRNWEPVASWPERKEAWWDIEQGIRAVIAAL